MRSRISVNRLYKLTDRKYLMTGSGITDNTGSLQTEGWAFMVGDRSGNVHVMNDLLDLKILDAQSFKTGDIPIHREG